MDYFPAFLNLKGKRCLLVGAGAVAARKARLLLAAGADLTVVAPEIGADVAALGRDSARLHVRRKDFDGTDVRGHWLIVCATDDAGVQRAATAAAAAARVFCNVVDDAGAGSYITPAIVDRGALVVAVSSGGTSPVLARRIRAQIEALLPATLSRLAALAGRWRRRVASRIADIGARRRFWEQVLDGDVAGLVHRGDERLAETALGRRLAEYDADTANGGMAWLVGAGPGDPGLLTLRALQVMQAADVVVHDRLVPESVLSLGRRDAERISVGKQPGCRKNSQEDTNALLVSLVRQGRRVCRLKGGDPFIFGRGGEEAEALRAAGLPVEIVPGVTAAAGCAAAAGIPLTHRDAAQSVVLLTAHGKDSVDTLDWASLARDRQTLAIYMAVRRLGDVMNGLIAHGRPADTPVAIIENGTLPEQRIIRGSLGQLTLLARAHRIESPAMLIVGEVARRACGAMPDARGRGPSGTAAPDSAIQRVANNTKRE